MLNRWTDNRFNQNTFNLFMIPFKFYVFKKKKQKTVLAGYVFSPLFTYLQSEDGVEADILENIKDGSWSLVL